MTGTPTWLAYTGAITGVVGAILGFVGYRHAKELKKLDLRLQLRKDTSDVHAMVLELPKLLDVVRSSHSSVLTAQGLGRSGNMQAWEDDWQNDADALTVLQQKLPEREADYRDASPSALERQVVTVHGLGTRARRLHEKCLSQLASDDAMRAEIRANIERRF